MSKAEQLREMQTRINELEGQLQLRDARIRELEQKASARTLGNIMVIKEGKNDLP